MEKTYCENCGKKSNKKTLRKCRGCGKKFCDKCIHSTDIWGLKIYCKKCCLELAGGRNGNE